ncbi:MAG: hypothetical protein U5N86_00820 [Planctomycetota bacterium]|nr:hypothetical protein [Planctomycetota bacterium]
MALVHRTNTGEGISILDEEDYNGDSDPQITTPCIMRMKKTVKGTSSCEAADILAKAGEVLSWFQSDEEVRGKLFSSRGLSLSTASEGLRAVNSKFDPKTLGFAKFKTFLQYACRNKKICVAENKNGDYVLAHRANRSRDMEFLEDLDDDFLHSEQNYRDIISASQPSLKIPPRNALQYCAAVLTTFNGNPFSFENGVREFVEVTDNGVKHELAKHCMYAFQRSGVLKCLTDDMPVRESTFELKEEYETKTDVLNHIGKLSRRKLAEVFGEAVNEDILKNILPEEAFCDSDPNLF